MSQKKVRAIYEGRLATWAAAQSPALRVQYENVPFVPIDGETYIRAFQFPAETGSETLDGAHRAYTGVFQASIVAPINVGSGAANTLADSLAAYFVHDARLTSAGFTVQQVSPASVAAALQGPGTYILPVSWRYRADTV